MGVVIGVGIVVSALVVSVGIAYALKWKNGRFNAVDETAEVLTAEQIGAPLGERATMVQFSSAFCSPCRATRVLLTDIAGKVDGVVTVEIDAEEHLELVRELDIMRTPTVLILDSRGAVSTRASGLPRRDQVLAALGLAIPARH